MGVWSTRIIIAGGGDTGVELAKALIKEKHEVVLIESDKARVEELAEKLDCLVIHGDATNPSVLEESGVREADILIALMGDDHDNIVVSLIAKSRGVKKIIVRVNDPSYNDTLIYMGIEDIVNPSKLVVNQILAMVRGVNLFYLPIALHSSIRYQVHRIGKKLDGKKVSDCLLYTSPSPRDRG